MENKIIETIEKMVKDIYLPDQPNLQQDYLACIDTIATSLSNIADACVLNEKLIKLQNSYERKDYIELSDILLYEIQPILLQEE